MKLRVIHTDIANAEACNDDDNLGDINHPKMIEKAIQIANPYKEGEEIAVGQLPRDGGFEFLNFCYYSSSKQSWMRTKKAER